MPAHLHIEAGIESHDAGRVGDSLGDVGGGVLRIDRIDNVLALLLDVESAEEERSILCKRPGDEAGVGVEVIVGLLGEQGVRRVGCRGVAVAGNVAVELLRAGFGDDLDTAITDAVVLGGKRILVYANLQDGRLGRKLPPGESVDVDLAAVRSCSGACQLLEFSLQFIGIVGEGIEVAAFEDQGAGVLLGVDADTVQLGFDCNDLVASRDLQRQVQFFHAPGFKRNALDSQRSKTWRIDFDGVGARGLGSN